MSLNWLTLNSRTGAIGVANVFWPYLNSLSLIVVVGYSSLYLGVMMNWYFFQFGLIFFGTLATGFVWGYFAHKFYIEDQENQ